MFGGVPVPGKILCYFVHDAPSNTTKCLQHGLQFTNSEEAKAHKEKMLRRWRRRHPVSVLRMRVERWRSSRS